MKKFVEWAFGHVIFQKKIAFGSSKTEAMLGVALCQDG